MPIATSSTPFNEEPITTTDIVWGVSAVTYLWGGIAAWVMHSIPACMEQANTCGKVATAALIVNLGSLAVKRALQK